ncbi:MAG: aminoacyl-tRNA hydrolase [Candidatus Omnitrophota bacterium]
MKLIVGLGNPGQAYQGSRHNLGFSVIKSLAQSYRIILKKDSAAFSLSAKARVDSDKLILAMPLTFMNLSGIAVSALLKKYKLDLSSLLVVCDDLDLEFGRLKIRAKGSSGGQRGLQSIIDALESRSLRACA